MKKAIGLSTTEQDSGKITVEYTAIVTADTQEDALQIIYDELCERGGFTFGAADEQDISDPEEEEEEVKEKSGRKASNDPIPDGYLDVKKVSELTGLSAVNISVRMGKGTFPKPDDKHGQKNIWLQETIENFLAYPGSSSVKPAIDPIEGPEIEEIEEAEEPVPEYIDKAQVRLLTGFDDEIIDMFVATRKLPAPNDDEMWIESEIQEYVSARNKRVKR